MDVQSTRDATFDDEKTTKRRRRMTERMTFGVEKGTRTTSNDGGGAGDGRAVAASHSVGRSRSVGRSLGND